MQSIYHLLYNHNYNHNHSECDPDNIVIVAAVIVVVCCGLPLQSRLFLKGHIYSSGSWCG